VIDFFHSHFIWVPTLYDLFVRRYIIMTILNYLLNDVTITLRTLYNYRINYINKITNLVYLH